MKKIYKVTQTIKIKRKFLCGGGKAKSSCTYFCYKPEEDAHNEFFTIKNFGDACDLFVNKKLKGAIITSTSRFHKSYACLELFVNKFLKQYELILSSHFKWLKVSLKYSEMLSDYTMTELMNLLPAEQMADWLKDHGLAAISPEALTNA